MHVPNRLRVTLTFKEIVFCNSWQPPDCLYCKIRKHVGIEDAKRELFTTNRFLGNVCFINKPAMIVRHRVECIRSAVAELC